MRSHAAKEVIPKTDDAEHRVASRSTWQEIKDGASTVVNHLKRTGVGLVCAVGYFDP